MGAILRDSDGLTHYLGNTPLTIGRSRQNRLIYSNNQVSGKHAEIQPLGDGRYQVVDVGSSNGTRVNGVRLGVGVPQVLNPGDRLRLGGTGGVELVFDVEAAMVSPGPAVAGYAGAAPAVLVQGPPGPAAPAAAPPPDELPAPPGNGAAQGAGGFAPPPGDAPPNMVLAPLPKAIITPPPSRRFAKPLVILGSVLVVVLFVTGVVLGARGLSGQASKTQAPGGATPTSQPAVVQTARVSVQGKETTVLTNAQGLTLYYFTPDTATTIACTGTCVATWLPLLFDGSGTPAASSPLPGTLSVVQGAKGPQVAYNGHPLYTFSGDSAPGQANGQGKGGKWFVATPDLASQ